METIKAVCNWTRIGGCVWEKAVQTEFVDDEIIKPELSDILHDEQSLLLRRRVKTEPNAETEACNLQLKIFPKNKISGFTIVCSASKIEVFIGSQEEYYKTEHGNVLEDEIDEIQDLRAYRYDVEIDKSGVCDITLKFPTNSDEICIFAILLQIAPNPNGVTTLLPSGINIENVQKMLESSGQKLTPNAEKCKELLQMCNKATATTSTQAQQPQDKIDIAFEKLKIHLDKRLEKLESKMEMRMNAFESAQSAKMDEILKTLQALK